jgi:hypothetical protein
MRSAVKTWLLGLAALAFLAGWGPTDKTENAGRTKASATEIAKRMAAEPHDEGNGEDADSDGRSPVDLQLFLTKGLSEPSHFGGPSFEAPPPKPVYEFHFLVGNPGNEPFEFDTLKIHYQRPIDGPLPRSLSGQAVIFRGEQKSTYYFYDHPDAPHRDATYETPSTVTLGSRKGLFIETRTLGINIPQAGRNEVALMEVTLFLHGKPALETHKAVLPPLSRMPEGKGIEPQAVRKKGFPLPLIRASLLPDVTGAVDEKRAIQAFKRAHEVSNDANLKAVRPHRVRNVTYGTGKSHLFPSEWHYFFGSRDTAAFEIETANPQKVSVTSHRDETPYGPISMTLLKSCRLDYDGVGYLMDVLGAKFKQGPMDLISTAIDGRTRPLWRAAFQLEGKPLGVLADTGEVVSWDEKSSSWQFVEGLIWNANSR